MRKKSHISLARYIVNDMKIPVMTEHRKAFYLGSILPDCKPSFLTQRHEFDGTFDMVKERIRVLSEDSDLIVENGRVFMRRLGEVIHYIADYFNSKSWYQGTIDPDTFDAEQNSIFNEYELANISKIAEWEEQKASQGN